jgi:hypothetical protein
MKKFLAPTVFEIQRQHQLTTEFDIQYRLITAHDAPAALIKAVSHARKQEGLITSLEGVDMYWKFVGIVDLYAIDEVEDGGEVFSQSHQTAEPMPYVQFVKQRTMAMQAKNLIFV